MRINVYSQELTKETSIVVKEDDQGHVHHGVRMFFESSPKLHYTKNDDDRSAITFWLPNTRSFTAEELAVIFEKMAALIRTVKLQ